MQKIGFNEYYGLNRAVFTEQKTMTRRIEKPLNNAVEMYRNSYIDRPSFNIISQRYTERGGIELRLERDFLFVPTRYKVGEIVAVAQSYKSVFEESLNYAIPRYHWLDDHIDEKGFANKMFVKACEMPHQIRITDIKIERLQDISEEDCLKEGIIRRDDMINSRMEDVVRYTFENSFVGGIYKTYATPREAFAALIERPGIGHKGDWSKNPWVVVYSFELVKKNIKKEV